MSENLQVESGYLNAWKKERLKDIDIKYQKSTDANESTPAVQSQGRLLLPMATNQHTLERSEERDSETI